MTRKTMRNAIFILLPVLLTVACDSQDAIDTVQQENDWPRSLTPPIQGATFSMSADHLPGGPAAESAAARPGFTFVNGASGRPLQNNETVVAVDEGEIVRIDLEYPETDTETLEYWLEQSELPGDTGRFARDKLRGRQVWIRHPGDHLSKYAHLNAVNRDLAPGDAVERGQPIGVIGRTGLPAGEDGEQPSPRLHFELWSADGKHYMGQGHEVFEIHQALADSFGLEALPRYARDVLARVDEGQSPPDTYPPEDPPDYGFSIHPPKSVTAGEPFAVAISWEGNAFRPEDFFPMFGGRPAGIIDAGDGAWILATMPLGSAGSSPPLAVFAIDPLGSTLAGSRRIESVAREDQHAPREVAENALEIRTDDNLKREQQWVTQAAVHSLRTHEPQWQQPFRVPLEGDVTGPFGQEIFHAVTVPDYPRPGVVVDFDGATDVMASNDGTVVWVENLPVRGKTVALSHGGGVVSLYAGLSSVSVEPEQKVSRAEVLGKAERPLQWEIHVAGEPSNPLNWVDKLLPNRQAPSS